MDPRIRIRIHNKMSWIRHPEHCLKVASKFFSQKFACSSSVTGDDEIVIQGDVKDDLFDILPEKWPEIDEDLIDDIGEKKRS
jgi:density-regulated protein DRP1